MPLAILLACLNGSENVNADLQAGLLMLHDLVDQICVQHFDIIEEVPVLEHVFSSGGIGFVRNTRVPIRDGGVEYRNLAISPLPFIVVLDMISSRTLG